MKNLMKNLMVAGTLFALAGTAFAGTQFSRNSGNSECSKNSESSEKNSVPAVENLSDFQKNIAGTTFLLHGQQLKINAKFFIVLSSASWCGPCRAEMPKIAKAYREEIKQNPEVELILISFDNEKRALLWAKRDGMEFPITLHARDNSSIFGTSQPLPRGIPSISIFRSTGEHVITAHPGAIFDRWKEFCEQE